MVKREFENIEDAAAYILEDNKELKKIVEKEDAKKIAEEVARQVEKKQRKSKEKSKEEVKGEKEMVKENGLEIIEEEVVKTVRAKGVNGVYEGKNGRRSSFRE